MSKAIQYCFSLILLLTFGLNAQQSKTKTTDKFHEEGLSPAKHACQSVEHRADMVKRLNAYLKKRGIKGSKGNYTQKSTANTLEWPLKSASHYDECGYHSIFQYADHDPANPGSIEDWNCGTITYDVPGYDHTGTDIGIFPFGRTMQANEDVEVIAAAAGEIIVKVDGNYDQNCNANDPSWNYVMIRHSDGYYSVYGHLVENSLTTKQVGETVAVGEYLGLVGSSGASSGPHLHFEIMDPAFNPVDPYSGPCNTLPNGSMWTNQNDYYDQGINRVMTHFAAPNTGGCPAPETINEQTFFQPGSEIYFAAYLRHAKPSDTYTLKVFKPNGTQYWTNTASPSQFYSGYFFYFFFTIPSSQDQGQWTFECTTSYGDACSTVFTIQDCPQDLVLNTVVPSGTAPMDEEADNSISSTAVIEPNNDVKYDAGNCIELQAGFEAQSGAHFEAFLDGCGGN